MVESTRAALELLTPKWRIDVLYLLARGARRYATLHRELGTISKKVLTQTLRALEDDGFVERTVDTGSPVKVTYALTPRGWSVTELLTALSEWGRMHAETGPAAGTARAAEAA